MPDTNLNVAALWAQYAQQMYKTDSVMEKLMKKTTATPGTQKTDRTLGVLIENIVGTRGRIYKELEEIKAIRSQLETLSEVLEEMQSRVLTEIDGLYALAGEVGLGCPQKPKPEVPQAGQGNAHMDNYFTNAAQVVATNEPWNIQTDTFNVGIANND